MSTGNSRYADVLKKFQGDTPYELVIPLQAQLSRVPKVIRKLSPDRHSREPATPIPVMSTGNSRFVDVLKKFQGDTPYELVIPLQAQLSRVPKVIRKLIPYRQSREPATPIPVMLTGNSRYADVLKKFQGDTPYELVIPLQAQLSRVPKVIRKLSPYRHSGEPATPIPVMSTGNSRYADVLKKFQGDTPYELVIPLQAQLSRVPKVIRKLSPYRHSREPATPIPVMSTGNSRYADVLKKFQGDTPYELVTPLQAHPTRWHSPIHSASHRCHRASSTFPVPVPASFH